MATSTAGWKSQPYPHHQQHHQQQQYQPFGSLRNYQSIDIQSSVFSVNGTGRTAVAADSDGLCVIGLNREKKSPFPVHRILHKSSWAVNALECCKHAGFPERVATSSRNNVLIWDISAETAPLMQVIRHHQWPVTALAWSHGNGNILASASVGCVDAGL